MSQRTLRQRNRRAALRALLDGPTSRSQLAGELNLTQAAISRIVRELISAGVLAEGATLPVAGRPGRQLVQVDFARDRLFVVGLGLEAFSQRLTIGTLRGEPVLTRTLDLGPLDDVAAVLDGVAAHLDAMLGELGVEAARVLGIGAAVVGIVDRRDGCIVRSTPLGWREVRLAAELEARTGIPAVVENLLHATNQAERAFGVSKGAENVLLARTSLSVGISAIADGELIRGGAMNAGQISHVPARRARDRCTCGRTGCLEVVASGRAVVARAEGRRFADLGADRIRDISGRLADVLARAEGGDSGAAGLLRDAGHALGRALEAPCATLDPEMIVLSGPVGRHPDYLDGVRIGLGEHNAVLRTAERRLEVSTMSTWEAALRLATTEFLTLRDLDIAGIAAAQTGPDRSGRTSAGQAGDKMAS